MLPHALGDLLLSTFLFFFWHPCLVQLGTNLAPTWSQVGAKLGLCWAILGLCWAILASCWAISTTCSAWQGEANPKMLKNGQLDPNIKWFLVPPGSQNHWKTHSFNVFIIWAVHYLTDHLEGNWCQIGPKLVSTWAKIGTKLGATWAQVEHSWHLWPSVHNVVQHAVKMLKFDTNMLHVGPNLGRFWPVLGRFFGSFFWRFLVTWSPSCDCLAQHVANMAKRARKMGQHGPKMPQYEAKFALTSRQIATELNLNCNTNHHHQHHHDHYHHHRRVGKSLQVC